jgi:hypothetical protein
MDSKFPKSCSARINPKSGLKKRAQNQLAGGWGGAGAGRVWHMQFFTALLAWLALLALAANPTTWASSADAASRPYDVNVKGGPEFVDEHSQLMLPGKYIATLFLELTRQQVSNAARVGALHIGYP